MVCIILPFLLFLVLAIAAVILHSACHLAKETVPGFGMAMLIVFVTGVIQGIIGTVINAGFGLPVLQDPANQAPVDPGTALAASIVGFLINTPVTMLLYKLMIPTESFGKAALVWLIQLLIYICIGVIIFVLFFVLGLALGGF